MKVMLATGVLAIAVPAYASNGNGNAYGKDGGDGKPKATATPTPPVATPTPRGNPTPTPTSTATPTATPDPSATPAPTPVRGHSVVTGEASGNVRVRSADGDYVDLDAAATAVPVGSVVDTRAGTVVLRAALPGGATDAGRFTGGVFEVRQDARTGVTDLYLRGGSFKRCSDRTLASTTASRTSTVRSLWGHDDGGRFRTHGHNSVATVRGTRWLTRDRCDGTLTRVSSGAVDVRNTRTGRRVTVRAGGSYLARAR